MRKIRTNFKGLYILKGKKFGDSRGWLREVFKKNYFNKNNIFTIVSKSKKNVLRGLHLQKKNMQAKFVTVLKGKILDVVVDLRIKSKTFGKIFSIVLSKKNALGLYIPSGFAHAYYSYERENIIYYKLDNYYNPKFESGIIYNDKSLKLKLPYKIIVS